MTRRSKKQKKRRAWAYILRVLCVLAILTLIALIVLGIVKVSKHFSNRGISITKDQCLEVSGKGNITETITSAFDSNTYSFDDLKAQAEKEIGDYNKIAGSDKAIKQKKLELKDNTVEMILTYASDGDFRSFNGKRIYVGTMKELRGSGIDFGVPMKRADGAHETINDEELQEGDKHHAIVLEGDLMLTVPKKILYTSDNVISVNDTTVEVNAGEELAYIIYK